MSTDGERSPKRQRRSYSPASPALPLPETKHTFVHQPETPPPSVHMSPSWTAQSSTTTSQQPFPTPPSTSGIFSQRHTGSVGSEAGESGTQTPVHADGDAEMTEAIQQVHGEVGGEGGVGEVKEDAEHRRTDHERHTSNDPMDPIVAPPPPPRLYKTHTKPIAPSRPHTHENIIERYGLQDLQRSVARRDEAGNKINALRKTYAGKVKNLELAGRPTAKLGNGALGGLVDPGWSIDVGNGQTLWEVQKAEGAKLTSLSDGGWGDVERKLASAFAGLRPGMLPKAEHQEWHHNLGLDVDNTATPNLPATKPGLLANPALAKTAPAQALRNQSAPASPGMVRPDRQGKKRSYHDSSFAGYNEGFVDDDGYSTGDGANLRNNSTGKRQKLVGGGGGASPPAAGGGGGRKVAA